MKVSAVSFNLISFDADSQSTLTIDDAAYRYTILQRQTQPWRNGGLRGQRLDAYLL